MLKTWAMQIELTFPVNPEDIKERFPGDAEVDYSRRALRRIRPHLESLLEDTKFAHYHITELPRRVLE